MLTLLLVSSEFHFIYLTKIYLFISFYLCIKLLSTTYLEVNNILFYSRLFRTEKKNFTTKVLL